MNSALDGASDVPQARSATPFQKIGHAHEDQPPQRENKRLTSAARKRHAKVCKSLKLLVAKTSVNIRKSCYFLGFIGFFRPLISNRHKERKIASNRIN
jgi:hypothetical protein